MDDNPFLPCEINIKRFGHILAEMNDALELLTKATRKEDFMLGLTKFSYHIPELSEAVEDWRSNHIVMAETISGILRQSSQDFAEMVAQYHELLERVDKLQCATE